MRKAAGNGDGVERRWCGGVGGRPRGWAARAGWGFRLQGYIKALHLNPQQPHPSKKSGGGRTWGLGLCDTRHRSLMWWTCRGGGRWGVVQRHRSNARRLPQSRRRPSGHLHAPLPHGGRLHLVGRTWWAHRLQEAARGLLAAGLGVLAGGRSRVGGSWRQPQEAALQTAQQTAFWLPPARGSQKALAGRDAQPNSTWEC